MKILDTEIAGVHVVETHVIADERGSFMRLFCADELAALLGQRRIVQANQSRTAKTGAIRGLHYQAAPHAETKFIRCIKGRVWDVALDIRANSPTFLKWHAEELSAGNHRMMVVPEGCAHGFQVLEPESEMLYFHTASYEPLAEGAINYAEPRAGISWPLPITDISSHDASHPMLAADFRGL